MRSSHLLRVAVAALLVSQAALSQESKTEEVVVTSSALRENPLEVAQPTSVVGGDDLRRQIAASIGETLSSELGVSSDLLRPSASRPVIRGLAGDRVQVLQDGLASLDVSSLSQDHAVTLETVVSSRSKSSRSGRAAVRQRRVGRLGERRQHARAHRSTGEAITGAVEVRGDTAGEERTGAFSLDGGAGNFAFHADYFDRDTDDVEIPGFTQSDALRRQLHRSGRSSRTTFAATFRTPPVKRAVARSAARTSVRTRLGGLSYSRYETTYGIPGEEEAFIDMKQDRFDGKAELDLEGAINKLRLTGAYNDYTHTEFEAPGVPGTVFNQDAYELRFTADHEFGGGWRGTTGLQYVDVDFEAIGDEAFVPSSKTQTLSVFAFEERHFDNWTIELGARAEQQKIDVPADYPDYDETAISLSAGAVWDFADDHALALNLTRTQRNPQAAELYANGPHIAAQRFEVGDVNLDQETSVTADLSLRHTGDGINWTLSAYYNDYTDYIYASPTGEIEDDLPVYAYLQNGAKFYGFEAEVNVPLIDDGDDFEQTWRTYFIDQTREAITRSRRDDPRHGHSGTRTGYPEQAKPCASLCSSSPSPSLSFRSI